MPLIQPATSRSTASGPSLSRAKASPDPSATTGATRGGAAPTQAAPAPPPAAPPASTPAQAEPERELMGVPGPDRDIDRPPPMGFEGLAYTSVPKGQIALIESDEQPHYVAGAVGTPPEVGELDDAGAANFLNPAWQEQVRIAVERNGGLGNAQDGYLAFSKMHGFVRLKHVGLSAEQNRRFAAMSLQTGWSVETLPTRTGDNGFEKPETFAWADEFLGRYDAEMADFIQDPMKNGIAVSSGKRKYHLEFNEKAQGFVSYEYKKHGGIKGFVQKHMKYIGPVLDVVSVVGHMIPGVGTAIALGARAMRTAVNWIATGALKARDVVATVASYFMPAGLKAATPTQIAAYGAANVAAEAIDTGKVRPSTLASAFTPLIEGLPGGVVADHAVRQGLTVLASGIENGKVSARDVYGALAPLVFDLPKGEARDQLAALANQIAGGTLTAEQAQAAVRPLVDSVTGDPTADRLLYGSLGVLAEAIDTGRVDPRSVLAAAAPFVEDRLTDLRGGHSWKELIAAIADDGRIDAREIAALIGRYA